MSSDFFVTYVPDRSTCTYVRRVCDLSAVASNCSARTIEQPEINEFAYCFVASRIGVRPVAVPCRRHCRSRTAIGQSHDGPIFHERVEVDHTVEQGSRHIRSVLRCRLTPGSAGGATALDDR